MGDKDNDDDVEEEEEKENSSFMLQSPASSIGDVGLSNGIFPSRRGGKGGSVLPLLFLTVSIIAMLNWSL